MKHLLFTVLLVPALVHGQTKFSQLLTISPDNTTSIVGLKYASGMYTDYLFTLSSMAAYIASVNPVPGLNNTLISNPNTDKNINIGITNPFSTYAYKFINIGLDATPDSAGYITVQDSLGNSISEKVTTTHPKILLNTTSGNSTAVTDTQVAITGGTVPLVLNGATVYALAGNTAKDSIQFNTSGTFAFTSQLADTAAVLRTVIPGLNAVLGAGNTSSNTIILNDGYGDISTFNTGYLENAYPPVSGVTSLSHIDAGNIGFYIENSSHRRWVLFVPDTAMTPFNYGGTLMMPGWKSAPLALAGDNITPTKTTGTGAGSPTTSNFGTNSDDNSGTISIGVGSSAAASATIATITFNTPFPGKAIVVLTPANAAAAALYGAQQVYAACNYPATSFTIKSGSTALSASVTYQWNYVVMK